MLFKELGRFCELVNFKFNTLGLTCLTGCSLKGQAMSDPKAIYNQAKFDDEAVYANAEAWVKKAKEK